MIAMILSTRSGPWPGSIEASRLHRRSDQPGAATAARFWVGIDLLRQHLGTLAVQSRRKRLTRNVTPHPCIVARARSARKDLVASQMAKTKSGRIGVENTQRQNTIGGMVYTERATEPEA
jgi:hypothetical protein